MNPTWRLVLVLAASFVAAVSPPPSFAQEDAAAADAATWTKTASGLEYRVLSGSATGEHAKLGDTVTVHYTGTLVDGTKFDSSRDRGEPARFPLMSVIAGWQEGIRLMTPGSRFEFRIPPQLGYGDRAVPGIPAGSTLVFDVELIDVQRGPEVPEFAKVDPAAAEKTESGLLCQTLAEGAGAAAAEDQVVELQYTCWNEEGKLVMSSALSGETLKGTSGDMPVAFLRECAGRMKPGERWLVEVPPEQGFGAQARGPDLPPNSTTVWLVELLRVLEPMPVPPFARPAGDDVTTTASGLKIQTMKEGSGVTPRMGQAVVVHYAGWLTDGTPFDSSYSRAEPAEFVLGRVIPGWNEALQRMKAGGVALLEIPPDLAYGPRANGKIPANSTLVFRVELIEVK